MRKLHAEQLVKISLDQKLRTAIIGCGKVAGDYDEDSDAKTVNTHAKAYQLEPEADLVAIVDHDEKKAINFSKRWGNPNVYTDLLEMFKVEKPDIVSICTPTSTHTDMLEHCIKSPEIKGVWCEKPIGVDLDKAEAIVAEYSRSKVVLAVNYQRKWDLQMLRIKKALKAGELGEIQKLMVYYSKGIINNGSHAIDLILDWLGNPTEITVLKAQFDYNENDPTVDAHLKFNDSSVYLIGVDERQYTLFEMDILGKKGRIKLKRNKSEWYQRVIDPIFTGYHMLKLQKTASPLETVPPMSFALKNIIQAIKTGQTLNSTGQSALATLRTCQYLAVEGVNL